MVKFPLTVGVMHLFATCDQMKRTLLDILKDIFVIRGTVVKNLGPSLVFYLFN